MSSLSNSVTASVRDYSSCRMEPFAHQRIGIEQIIAKPAFFLMDEMGAGKTKQTIDAAQFLYHARVIDRMIVVCPATVRSVWFDPELGELSKHLWLNTPTRVTEYHARSTTWLWPDTKPAGWGRLEVIITNYDFIREKARLGELLKSATKNTLLVLDESSAVKNPKAVQTASVWKLRQKCGRVLLLNGTPIENSPLDIYSQADIMDPLILGVKNFFHFRARYAVMGGWEHRQIIGWHDLEDMQARLAPYCIRRMKEDCLDLPEKLPPVTLTVPLKPATWKVYKDMRDDMVAWLSDTTVVTAQQAIVKALRLSQITSGFVGGIERMELSDDSERPDWLPFAEIPQVPVIEVTDVLEAREVGREKLDAFFDWFADRLIEDTKFKLLVWCRFRPELDRLLREMTERFPSVMAAGVHGGQKKHERDLALRMLDPRTAPKGPALVAGTLGTGAKGLNLTAAHTVFNLSNSTSLGIMLQSMDRVHRPGQVHAVSYYDLEATGPQGQKTIDHHIIRALRTKNDMATWTTSAWKRALLDE